MPVPSAKGPLGPIDLLRFLPYPLTACSDRLGWRGVRVESWREPTAEGEIACPAGTHDELIVPLTGPNTTFRAFGPHRYTSANETLLNEFDFIPGGYENTWKWSDGGCEYASFDIEPGFLHGIAHQDLAFAASDLELRPVAGGKDQRLRSLAMMLVGEMESGGPSGELFADSLLTALAVLILKHCAAAPRVATVPGPLPMKALERIRDLVRADLSRSIRLSELAALAGCSTWTLCRQFKRTIGCTPHQFVIGERIQEATRLLRQRALSLSEIALMTGFSSQAHFSSVFARRTGLSPAVFRRDHESRRTIL